MKLIHYENIGDLVLCDFCNQENDSMGGTIIGSYAICGVCSEKNGYYNDDYKYKDEISRILPKDKTFKQNVLDYRDEITGSTNGTINIWSVD